MHLKSTLQIIHEHNISGYKRLVETREVIFKALKEYLELKYEKSVRFFPEDKYTDELLNETDYYPDSIIVTDKHGYAASSCMSYVKLNKDGKIQIGTEEAGTLYDAEEYLSNDDLFRLCDSIEKYEKTMQKVRERLAETHKWERRAEDILSKCTDATTEQITCFISEHWQKLLPDNENIIHFKSFLKNKNLQ